MRPGLTTGLPFRAVALKRIYKISSKPYLMRLSAEENNGAVGPFFANGRTIRNVATTVSPLCDGSKRAERSMQAGLIRLSQKAATVSLPLIAGISETRPFSRDF